MILTLLLLEKKKITLATDRTLSVTEKRIVVVLNVIALHRESVKGKELHPMLETATDEDMMNVIIVDAVNLQSNGAKSQKSIPFFFLIIESICI